MSVTPPTIVHPIPRAKESYPAILDSNFADQDAFNRAVLDFVTAVDSGRWSRRNPDSLSASAILRTKRP